MTYLLRVKSLLHMPHMWFGAESESAVVADEAMYILWSAFRRSLIRGSYYLLTVDNKLKAVQERRNTCKVATTYLLTSVTLTAMFSSTPLSLPRTTYVLT